MRQARNRRSALAVTVAIVALLAGLGSSSSVAAPGEDDTPIANPDLDASCGLDILVTLDESGSIGSSGATDDVQQAFRAFTSALKNTGSRLAVSEFSTVASLPIGDDYVAVTDATIAGTFEPYIDSYDPDGTTNWEDGFRVDRYFLPRPSQTTPHLVVFITDGDPTRLISETRVTYDPGNPSVSANEYELKVPLDDDDETVSADENDGKDQAVPNANAIKAQGSHILVVAVGEGLSSQSSLDRIIDISGGDVFSGNGTFDITTDDVYSEPDFSRLEEALRDAAFQLCSPSVNVRKLVDVNADPAVDDLQPGQGWTMTATASPTPDSWVLPAGASGPTATTTTGPDGFANFQWSTGDPTDSSITVNEEPQAGYVNDPSATTCTYRTPDSPNDQPLPNLSPTQNGFSGTVPAESIVTCEMVNRLVPSPAIQIEKATNGADADSPPGPFVPLDQTVTWTYVVTNTGNVPLSGVAVTDDQGVSVSCPTTSLAPGEEMACTATASAVAGPYANVGTVTATDPDGTPVGDDDPSHYVGIAAGIDIEKATNGQDADTAPGPFLTVGAAVTWTYVVTNTGNTPLASVVVTDDQGVTPTFVGGDTDGDSLLDPTETWTYQAAGTAAAGPYENVGTVQASGVDGPVADSDPSHYFGSEPEIEIEKYTNGAEADAAPGPHLEVGSPVTWTYQVTNTGNVPLRNWSVTDDQGVTPICPTFLILRVGQTVTCFAEGTAEAGQYTNVGTVNATTALGAPVAANDPANYFGDEAGIVLEKSTNGADADRAPGPYVPVGGAVTWTYHVTNTGNTDLTGVLVVDLRAVGVSCPQTTLAAGASMDCTASGSADAEQYANLAFARGETDLGDVVRAIDPSHYFGATPGIHLEKYTNGVNADFGNGPLIPIGDTVEWTYIITNSGNLPLSGIVLTDAPNGAVDCPATTLAPEDQLVCTATGTASAGRYENTGSVTATDTNGTQVSDTDPSHYLGLESGIHVEKLTNTQDADSPPGPPIPAGNTVTWTYEVTNPGTAPIRGIEVTDNRGPVPVYVSGDADGDQALDPGETWTYRATGTAEDGQYSNTATATGLDALERPVADTDPSHYFGGDGPAPGPPTPPSPPSPPTPPGPAPSPPSPPPSPPTPVNPITPRDAVVVVTKRAKKKSVRAGQTVRFSIRVRNLGQRPATDLRVCDVLPERLVFVRAAGARFVRGDACWTIRRLRPRQTWHVTVRVKPVRVSRRVVVVNVARADRAVCSNRAATSADRATRVCRARVRLVIRPAAGRPGGVTG